ncbi:hypothetical protein N7462_005962 [Penicillium macrosclerotiorum]|uniref:uncharacterized protein n=1 Tax=Penicillium macrosclerotiorum TaxID=303699 RepID=UPI002547AEC1|nr:uncharacterized protein N7462_005962 [Penicillium macrosclerotiorum]KAJ5682797.1 hypothetical protein N7462_005962 [Penicillium macrosclerotiorum]
MDFKRWPEFNELPLDPSGPPGNAWGLWGRDDQLGMLNLLTPEVVAASAREIQRGIRISLDWPFDKPMFPTDGRKRFEHRIIPHADVPMNDDEVYLNTQSSTQWDGFRHFGYKSARRFYNGHFQEDFQDSSKIGIDQWVIRGGIIGRGILLDWAEWATRNGREAKALQSGAILLEDIKAIIKEQRIEIHQGDILFLRVGFTVAYNALTDEEKQRYPDRRPGGLLGLEATEESLRWLWESRFAAVASDSPSFERGPVDGPHNHPDISIHQWALAGWGLPLGEMFDLEELARTARRLGRYSFFLTSVPIKVPGGVASPPNAVAIF